jgi:hypothetical protein
MDLRSSSAVRQNAGAFSMVELSVHPINFAVARLVPTDR